MVGGKNPVGNLKNNLMNNKTYLEFFTPEEKEKLLAMKFLNVKQASYWCRLPVGYVYKLIKYADKTGFPVLPRVEYKKKNIIPIEPLIKWRTELFNRTLPPKQLQFIATLLKKEAL